MKWTQLTGAQALYVEIAGADGMSCAEASGLRRSNGRWLFFLDEGQPAFFGLDPGFGGPPLRREQGLARDVAGCGRQLGLALGRDYPGLEGFGVERAVVCLLYTSPSPRDRQKSRMPSSA